MASLPKGNYTQIDLNAAGGEVIMEVKYRSTYYGFELGVS